MEYIVNIETSSGEGLVFVEEFNEDFPLYERVYIPFVEGDSWPLEVLSSSEVVNTFKSWFYQRPGVRIVSVMLAQSFEIATDFIDKTEDRAFDLAVQSGHQCRVVMRDGIGDLIGPGFVKDRINLWVAKDFVYRAEFF